MKAMKIDLNFLALAADVDKMIHGIGNNIFRKLFLVAPELTHGSVLFLYKTSPNWKKNTTSKHKCESNYGLLLVSLDTSGPNEFLLLS